MISLLYHFLQRWKSVVHGVQEQHTYFKVSTQLPTRSVRYLSRPGCPEDFLTYTHWHAAYLTRG